MDDLHVLTAGVGGFPPVLTATALTGTCTTGRVLSALPYNSGAQTDHERLLDQLPTTTPAT